VCLLLAADGAGLAYIGRHGSSTRHRSPIRSNVGQRVVHNPPPAPETVLRPDQSIVTGKVTSVHVVGGQGMDLRLPLTVTIPNRGRGELDIDGVTIGDRHGASVAWDGGQPLPLAGTGALELGPATMDANVTGITWHLDGAPRLLRPGQYVAESAVAVGAGGLGQPLDQARFVVSAGSPADLVSVGDAQVHLAPGPESLRGPGTVELLGRLTIRTAAGTRLVHNVHFGPGPFTLDLRPAAGGYVSTGLFQGPLDVLS
jgi:hypothetical protein